MTMILILLFPLYQIWWLVSAIYGPCQIIIVVTKICLACLPKYQMFLIPKLRELQIWKRYSSKTEETKVLFMSLLLFIFLGCNVTEPTQKQYSKQQIIVLSCCIVGNNRISIRELISKILVWDHDGSLIRAKYLGS